METVGGALPDEWQVAITLCDTPPEHAVWSVNMLARSYAEAYKAQWKASVDRTYEAARIQGEQGEQRLHETQLRLASALDREVQAAEAAAHRAPPATPPATSAGDNPDWTEARAVS